MKAIYLKNFRKGYATNSSSTHSVIYKNKDEMFEDLNIFEQNYYDRCDNTIAATKEAKIKYVAANIFGNDTLFDVMSKYYPEMEKYRDLIEKQKKWDELPYTEREDEDVRKEFGLVNTWDYDIFGMASRGSLYFNGDENIVPSIEFLREVIEDDDIVIVGGSDEMDFVYDTTDGHEEVKEPSDFYGSDKKLVKNGNYYVGYSDVGKVRFSFSKDECVPDYPELIDLKITNKCDHGCKFCYMGSNMQGVHADIKKLEKYIDDISTKWYGSSKKAVEFSVGGGNVLLYPELDRLFHYMHENNHIINTTINAKDCQVLIKDESLLATFKKYVSAIGISVSSLEDLEYLEGMKEVFTGDYYKQMTIHLIPEYLGADLTREIMDKLIKEKKYYSYLFLGYKTNGRGATQKWNKLNKNDLDKLFANIYCISVDTTFANRYKDWLKNNYETEKTITYNEGEYSMYIDGVTGNAYKSSYELEKPYSLDYDEEGNWYTVKEAFNAIREDCGFTVNEKNLKKFYE